MLTKARKLAGWVKWRLQQNAMKLVYGLPEVKASELLGQTAPLQPMILDDICLPPHYHDGPKDHDDFTPLMRIAQAIGARTIVELGTAHGNTVANLCAACPEATVHTVNAPADVQTGGVVTFELGSDDIGRVYRHEGFSNRVIQILKNTLELDLSEHFARPTVDLAIVDACHDTDYVINDFHKVRPFMRAGGVVVLHDTHPSMLKHLQGSYLACMKLRRAGYDIRHIRDTWWGIWTNGDWRMPLGVQDAR